MALVGFESGYFFMSQEKPVHWVPDRLAPLKKGSGWSSQLELARTQGDEIVTRGEDQVGNNSRLNVRSKEYSAEQWEGVSREHQNLQLESSSYINRGANKSCQKALRDGYFESGQ